MFKAKKKFGQNFLTSKFILSKIVNVVDIKNKNVLEVGAGLGALTEFILNNNPQKFISIEIDKELYELTRNKFISCSNYTIINDNALKINENNLFNNEKINVISNLPYNVGTDLLIKWLNNVNIFSNFVLLLQKEVVDRIIAKPFTKDYGRLSIISQILCNTKKQFDVKPTNFTPQPKVMSSVILLTPKENININVKKLSFITLHLFNKKRKKIKNTILNLIKKNILSENTLNIIDLNKRPEEILVDEYASLTNFIKIDL